MLRKKIEATLNVQSVPKELGLASDCGIGIRNSEKLLFTGLINLVKETAVSKVFFLCFCPATEHLVNGK